MAFTRKYYRNYKKKPTTKKVVKKAIKSANDKQFAKKVQKVLNKNIEDKYAYKAVVDVNYNSGINSSGDLNALMPNINVGASDYQRVGDQTHGRRLNIKGHLITNLTYTAYSQCRIGVRMLVVQPKTASAQSLISSSATTWLSTLLKKGGTTVGFTGAVSDLYAPVNTDAITKYYDKVIYMNSPYIVGTIGAGIDVTTARSTKFFDISLKIKNKLFKYDEAENSGLTPTNYNPQLIIGYAHLDSASPDTVSAQVNMSWVSTLLYQDA